MYIMMELVKWNLCKNTCGIFLPFFIEQKSFLTPFQMLEPNSVPAQFSSLSLSYFTTLQRELRAFRPHPRRHTSTKTFQPDKLGA